MNERQRAALAATVEQTVLETPARDIHTHLYEPAFGDLLLWGIDDLLVYHYLVAEANRCLEVPEEKFWELPKRDQAALVWDTLFERRSPVSESCRGVLTTLQALGLDPRKSDLPALRKWFTKWKVGDYVGRCMELAGVRSICTTNSPFDDAERAVWERGPERDPRFTAALRIDPLLLEWPAASKRLAEWGYKVRGADLTPGALGEVRRFLGDWTRRLKGLYVMASLPPGFEYPAATPVTALIDKAVLPFCRESGLPFAVMSGVKRQVNPRLRLAGDGVGRSRMESLEALFGGHPEVKFLITMLSRENQHELCVLARKFRNLHVFGCWWFTNIPHLIDEITRMRLELLGLTFTAQHSDARVLDQIIYKWTHSRRLIARILAEKYTDLAETGWQPSKAEIERDVRQLLGGSFEAFLKA
jgi:hypothetical protein